MVSISLSDGFHMAIGRDLVPCRSSGSLQDLSLAVSFFPLFVNPNLCEWIVDGESGEPVSQVVAGSAEVGC